MRKLLVLLPLMTILGFFGNGDIIALAGPPADGCTTIKDGTLTYATATGYPNHYLGNQPLMPGYDIFGYNYQAHMFNGLYANVYLGRDGFPPYEGDTETYLLLYPAAASKWYWAWRDVQLMMQWNDAWLSNKDCDEDGDLDRHYSFPTYIGSGAWETNHMAGSYIINGGNGNDVKCHWNYFVKIVAAPEGAYVGPPYDSDGNGTWYAADGTEIGLEEWGSFAAIERIYNDPCEGEWGVEYMSPVGPGFGKF